MTPLDDRGDNEVQEIPVFSLLDSDDGGDDGDEELQDSPTGGSGLMQARGGPDSVHDPVSSAVETDDARNDEQEGVLQSSEPGGAHVAAPDQGLASIHHHNSLWLPPSPAPPTEPSPPRADDESRRAPPPPSAAPQNVPTKEAAPDRSARSRSSAAEKTSSTPRTNSRLLAEPKPHGAQKTLTEGRRTRSTTATKDDRAPLGGRESNQVHPGTAATRDKGAVDGVRAGRLRPYPISESIPEERPTPTSLQASEPKISEDAQELQKDTRNRGGKFGKPEYLAITPNFNRKPEQIISKFISWLGRPDAEEQHYRDVLCSLVSFAETGVRPEATLRVPMRGTMIETVNDVFHRLDDFEKAHAMDFFAQIFSRMTLVVLWVKYACSFVIDTRTI